MEVTVKILVLLIIIGVFLFELWLSMLNYQNRNAKIPKVVDDVYDDESYQKYQAYSMDNFKFGLIVRGIRILLVVVLLLSGFFVWLDKEISSVFNHFYLDILIFLFVYFIISFVIDIVVSYIHTFKIEEKYGFNRSTKKTFFVDKLKSFNLTIIFGGGLLYLLLMLHRNTGDLFFVYAWLVLTVIVLIINLIYTSVLVPLFNKLKTLEEGTLRSKIEDFAHSVGYEIDRISVMDASKRSSKLNAYFSGFGKSKRIVLYDTLIEKMSEEEIVAVLAHEIGHNKHKHIIFNLIQTVLTLSVYVLLLALFLNESIFSLAFGFDDINLGFNLILYSLLLSPVLMIISFLSVFISRKFEYQADNFVKVNGHGDDLISALKVLAKENFSNLTPHPLYVKLFYSHPPIAKRIEAIKS
jgi:STE24 endopeptidase